MRSSRWLVAMSKTSWHTQTRVHRQPNSLVIWDNWASQHPRDLGLLPARALGDACLSSLARSRGRVGPAAGRRIARLAEERRESNHQRPARGPPDLKSGRPPGTIFPPRRRARLLRLGGAPEQVDPSRFMRRRSPRRRSRRDDRRIEDLDRDLRIVEPVAKKCAAVK